MTNKSEKFVSLANNRVRRTIKCMQLISNLSNANNYEYTDEQVSKILRALNKEILNIKSSFTDSSHGSEEEFTL